MLPISPGAGLRIRVLQETDAAEVIVLLCDGFPRRDAAYWKRALGYLAGQYVPDGKSRFGFAIENEGRLVGVILNLWSRKPDNHMIYKGFVSNLSSWYVQPAFRSYAAMLLSRATKDADVVYLNVSAAVHTLKICEALGFQKYSSGQTVSVPMLAKRVSSVKVKQYQSATAHIDSQTRDMLDAHVAMGCHALLGESNGQIYPMLFVRRRVKGFFHAMQMVLGPGDENLPKFMRALGVHFLKRGHFLLITDSEGTYDFVTSRYYEGRGARYFKGKVEPVVSDLTYTEIVAFGL
jgi:hypothetical protein